jgi:hypothetical protein
MATVDGLKDEVYLAKPDTVLARNLPARQLTPASSMELNF